MNDVGVNVLTSELFTIAFVTASVKVSHMTGDTAAEMFAGNICDAVNTVHLQIDYPAAISADKMVMLACIGIKVVYTIIQPKPLNFTDICQESQVAVDRSEADTGILLSDIHVDNIRCWVVMSTHQKVFDHIPLLTVF